MRRLIGFLVALAAVVTVLVWLSRQSERSAQIVTEHIVSVAAPNAETTLAASEPALNTSRTLVPLVNADVVPDAVAGEAQPVTMTTEGAIVGRVFIGKNPAPGARIVLSRESWRKHDGSLTPRPGGTESNSRTDLDAHAGRERTEFAEAGGEFRFEILAPGTYALRVSAEEAAPRLEREIRVQAGKTADVGLISMAVGGILRGRLITPPELSPVGYEILIYAPAANVSGPNSIEHRSVKIARDDGQFEFRGLAATSYAAQWRQPTTSGISFSDDASVPRVTVTAGNVSEIVLDASNTAPCTVAVSVLRRGAPFVGARVTAITETRFQSSSWNVTNFGITDAQGRVEGKIEGGLRFRLQLYESEKGPLLVDSAEDLDALPRGRIKREFRVETGSLVLVLPAGLVPPEKGDISVNLADPKSVARRISISTPGGGWSADRLEWNGPVIALGTFAAGTYSVRVSFRRYDADPAQANKFVPTELRPDFKTEIEVRADAETRLEVR